VKYTRLSKEQFEELHKEFINFLATQSVTAEEWSNIKANKPELAEQELDTFSDLVWEGVLNQAEYLENISPQHMYLFHLKETNMELIGLKLKDKAIDLTTSEGFSWLREHLLSDDVELFQAKKEYSEDKQLDKFTLIQQGSVITKGKLFTYFDKLVS
jgi:cag pathogenicity island protein 24